AVDRVKLLKLLWDAIGSEFGSRHELYEINYGGSTEEIRRYVLFGAMAGGTAKNLQGFAEQCMAEYDLDGWKVPDLVDPDELSYHVIRSAGSVSPRIAREQEGAAKLHSVRTPGSDFASSNQSGGFRNPYAVP
ncbi:MAG: 4-hydroxyphenylacetate 3-hydroxylase C-terminal domain-containing protein, partial [Pseudorhodoplanes sp.]